MAAIFNVEGFSKGENVRFSLYAKDRAGTALQNPASQIVRVLVTARSRENPIADITNASTLIDADQALYNVDITAEMLTKVVANKKYKMDIWTEYSGTDYHQTTGDILLKFGGKN